MSKICKIVLLVFLILINNYSNVFAQDSINSISPESIRGLVLSIIIIIFILEKIYGNNQDNSNQKNKTIITPQSKNKVKAKISTTKETKTSITNNLPNSTKNEKLRKNEPDKDLAIMKERDIKLERNAQNIIMEEELKIREKRQNNTTKTIKTSTTNNVFNSDKNEINRKKELEKELAIMKERSIKLEENAQRRKNEEELKIKEQEKIDIKNQLELKRNAEIRQKEILNNQINSFYIEPNSYLNRTIKAYYHTDYTRFRNPGNPDYINYLKNTKNDYSDYVLSNASKELEDVLIKDLNILLKIFNDNSIYICLIPRAKRDIRYTQKQLLFKRTVDKVINNLYGFKKGINYITRIKDTKTTHLKHYGNIGNFVNDGDLPYPGITKDTCYISEEIRGKKILLIDDVYTKTANIDEDAIQSLLDKGATEVYLYTIGKTVNNNY